MKYRVRRGAVDGHSSLGKSKEIGLVRMRFARNVGVGEISNKTKRRKLLQWGAIQNYNAPGVL
jgi:hypothetical protein